MKTSSHEFQLWLSKLLVRVYVKKICYIIGGIVPEIGRWNMFLIGMRFSTYLDLYVFMKHFVRLTSSPKPSKVCSQQLLKRDIHRILGWLKGSLDPALSRMISPTDYLISLTCFSVNSSFEISEKLPVGLPSSRTTNRTGKNSQASP